MRKKQKKENMQIKNISVANPSSAKQRGFTLIEMIGVLAVIAILASLLVPKVFGAIRDAQINGTALSVATIKTSVVDHYGKYNTLSQWSSNNTLVNLTFSGGVATNLDGFLLQEGLLDKPFSSKIATSASVQISTNGGFAGVGYKLDGVNIGTTNQLFVAEVVLSGVALQDAIDLSTRIDGVPLTPSPDGAGRVAYTNTNPTTVYIYLTGR